MRSAELLKCDLRQAPIQRTAMNTPHFKEVQFTNGYEFTEGTGYTLPEYPFVRPPELVHNKTLRHAVVIVGGGITGL